MPQNLMQAVRVHQYGGPEQLQLDQIPRPQPQTGEVLIRVYAAGVLPADCSTRQGGFINKSLPYIPGTAVAGVIEEVGPGVTVFQKGQAVCGRTTTGAYAEYTATLAVAPAITPDTPRSQVAALLSLLVEKPTSLSFDEAATLSGGATTAWTSIFEDGGLQDGQRVLIHGAAGGVGLFAVQFARWKGAHVIATTSTANVDFVRSLGAETVIDYTTTPFDQAARDVELVLDTIGGETLHHSMKLVKRGGTLVSVVEVPPSELARELGIRAINNMTIPARAHLQQIAQVIAEGHAKPFVRQSFSLRDAPQAHKLCETGHGRGRIVLRISV